MQKTVLLVNHGLTRVRIIIFYEQKLQTQLYNQQNETRTHCSQNTGASRMLSQSDTTEQLYKLLEIF